VAEYLAMRSYFVEVVEWAYGKDADRSTATQLLRARVDAFVAIAGGVLGSNRQASLAQVKAARDAGLSHCDVVVDGQQMLNLTNELLGFLQAIEDLRRLRAEVAPAPPAGMRAFVLACQAQIEDAMCPTRGC
jgi:hypothetical protein